MDTYKWYCLKCDGGKRSSYSVGSRERLTLRDGSTVEWAYCLFHPKQRMESINL